MKGNLGNHKQVNVRIEYHNFEIPIYLTSCQPSGDIARDIITASYLRGSWAYACFRRTNRDGQDDRCIATTTCLRLNLHRIKHGNAADRAAKSGVKCEAFT